MNLKELNTSINLIQKEMGSIAFERVSMEQKVNRLKNVHVRLGRLIEDFDPFLGPTAKTTDADIVANDLKKDPDIANDNSGPNAGNTKMHTDAGIINIKDEQPQKALKKKRQPENKSDEAGEL